MSTRRSHRLHRRSPSPAPAVTRGRGRGARGGRGRGRGAVLNFEGEDRAVTPPAQEHRAPHAGGAPHTDPGAHPPPAPPTLAEVMARQNQLMETMAGNMDRRAGRQQDDY